MRFLVACLLLLTAVEAQAQALLNNPKGLMGYRWGMAQKSAQSVHPLTFTCREGQVLSICRAQFPEATAQDVQLVLPGAGGSLALQFSKQRLIGLIHTFLSPRPMNVLTMLHNLLGPPSHRIEISKSLDSRASVTHSWVKPRTIIEVILSQADNTELPNTQVSVRAWSKKHYLRHHNLLPGQIR